MSSTSDLLAEVTPEAREAFGLRAADALRALRGREDWVRQLPDILEDLAHAVEASRAYVFQVHHLAGRGLGQTCIADWAATGLDLLTGDERNTDEDLTETDPTLAQWVLRRQRGEVIHGLTRDLRGYLRQDFEHQRIRSYVSAPIMVQGTWWGHLGFDDCVRERAWTDAQVRLLRLAADILAEVIERTEDAVLAGEALRTAMLRSALDCIVTIDEAGRILEFNPAAERTFGLARAEAIGRPLGEVVLPERHRHGYDEAFRRYLATGRWRILGRRIETGAVRADGTEFQVELTLTEIRAGQRRLFTAYLRDISQLKAAQAALERLAYQDETTGLPNRNAMARRLAADGRAERVVISIHLSDLGMMAASLGRPFADAILRTVAGRLGTMFLKDVFVARTGDADFGLILDEPAARAPLVAAAVQEGLRGSMECQGRRVSLRPRIGIAAGGTQGDMLGDAEMACLAATPGEVVRFVPELRTIHLRTLEIESELRAALRSEGQIWVAYQPIVAIANRGIVGFEALARWRHPRLGNVAPATFVPVAETTGLIGSLGRRIMESVAGDGMRWLAGDRQPFLAVNVSARQFVDPHLFRTILDVVAETAMSPSRIKIEITEGIMLDRSEATLAMLTEFKEAGFTLAIDDFGTGYSSLSYLRRLPVDSLKIDQSFIRRIHDSAEDREVVRHVIDLAHALCMTTIAEGVETEADLETLKSLGCDFAQGYLFGRPLPAEEAGAMLARAEPPSSCPPTTFPPLPRKAGEGRN